MAEQQRAYSYYLTSYELDEKIKIKGIVWLTYPLHVPPADKADIVLYRPDGSKKEWADSWTDIDYSIDYALDMQGTYQLQYVLDKKRIFLKFHFSVVENRLPLKKWTIATVINRLLDLAEPIRKGENPRFKLNAEQEEKFGKILAPQFSFTKQTLRECLQEVGKVVHGEPRLTPKKDEDGKWYYEVSYDLYTSQDDSGIRYVQSSLSQVRTQIESYLSHIDSSAENLVNQLDKFSGVIVEPYRGGAKTVRTENLYVRIEEGNMLIHTQYPIYSVDKLEYVYTDDGAVKSVDITPWLFEKSIYDSQLSSYDDAYPYSKAYGLYYTQGGKNVKGLNFKVESDSSIKFKSYAITNILRSATNSSGGFESDYPKMAFRVTYTPFYNARVAQSKVNYKDFPRAAGLIYNQTANVIESRYYGENLKGTVARLGNVEKTFTYILARLTQLPKAGQRFDEDYYISAVAAEILPTCIKCTVGLSKDFNRLSAYIGVNSEKRYSEISQNQAVERNTLWREYIVVGAQETPDNDCLIGDKVLAMIADTFLQSGGNKPLSNVCAWGTSFKGNELNAVNLPVISSAFGNSISFSWRYEDNYSAGAVAHYENSGNGAKGYFQNNQPYTDYYGKIFYYNFDLQVQGPQPDSQNLEEIGRDLPKGTKVTASSGYVSTVGKTPYILRKDNREALPCNFQIDFVTNTDIIIGSALASYCPAVRGSDVNLKAKLYVFDSELNKFTDHVEAWEDVELDKLPSADIFIQISKDEYFTVEASAFPADGKSWAIVTAQTKEEGGVQVEDEFGKISEEKRTTGGDLLIGRNIEVTAGQKFEPIYFTKKREIFDRTVWKDIV